MSKIGRMPITIPAGVTFTLGGDSITVKGSKGELSYAIPAPIKIKDVEGVLHVERPNDSKPVRALHGLVRALVANMITGVSVGFTKKLELVGTGYRAKLAGNKLVLSLGFSHEVEYISPANITLSVEGTNIINITGFDKQLVGEVAAKIRSYRKPEPYKGKGIRYSGEVVRRKAGKAAKAATK